MPEEIVYIALGSNLDSPRTQVCKAIDTLSRLPASRLLSQSSLYSSYAVGPGEQSDYVNAVVAMETSLEAQPLLELLQNIEKQHGRIRHRRWEPRPLDLDILLFGMQTIATETLDVPHPEMGKRHFVLYPLAEIAPELILPDGTSLKQLLAACPVAELRKLDNTTL